MSPPWGGFLPKVVLQLSLSLYPVGVFTMILLIHFVLIFPVQLPLLEWELLGGRDFVLCPLMSSAPQTVPGT